MPSTRHLRVKPGDVLVLIGTMKGAFLFRADRNRRRWDMGGPYFPGQPVYALAYDGRSGKRLWAGPESPFFGPALRYSDDFGRTWSDPKSNPTRSTP